MIFPFAAKARTLLEPRTGPRGLECGCDACILKIVNPVQGGCPGRRDRSALRRVDRGSVVQLAGGSDEWQRGWSGKANEAKVTTEVRPIPFSRASITEKEQAYVRQALESGELGGDGPFTARCAEWLRSNCGSAEVLLTHSCTAALEMAALLLDIQPGDEVVVPSYTFVSTANAFVLRGAIPVFVDVREDTLNLDERLLEGALTPRTRAIVPVHYAGVACEMDAIMEIATARKIAVVEDAAQAHHGTWQDKPLGSFGGLAALSFHVSKNITGGEGGALLINDSAFVGRAHIIREKGTNRTNFLRKEIAKYEWLDLGSSYLPSDLLAALLLAQLERSEEITARRRSVWSAYHSGLADLEKRGWLRRPIVPSRAVHGAHIYYVLFPHEEVRVSVQNALRAAGIHATTHYVPLHATEGGRRLGRPGSEFPVTERISETLLRLPLYPDLSETEISRVLDVLEIAVRAAFEPSTAPRGRTAASRS